MPPKAFQWIGTVTFMDVSKFPIAIQELSTYNQWVVWKPELINGKWTKPPYQLNGYKADKTNPQHWCSFEQAVTFAQLHPEYGLGFCLTQHDPFCCIDYDATNEPMLCAGHSKILNEFNSYTEYSPSGKGAHTWLRCKSPDNHNWKRTHALEAYSHDSYMTVTARPVEGFDVGIYDRKESLDNLVCELSTPNSRTYGKNVPPDAPQIIEDQMVIDRAKKSSNNLLFNSLWTGDTTKYNGNESEADLALMNCIAVHTDNKEQAARVFRMSELGKRDKPQQRDDYVLTASWSLVNKAFDKKVAPIPDLEDAVAGAKPPFFQDDFGIKFDNVLDTVIRGTRFLWPQWIPLGTLTTLGGRGGSFKSTIAYQIAAIVASGLNWPNGMPCKETGNVLIWTTEDSLDCTVPETCKRAGLKRGRYSVYTIRPEVSALGKSKRQFDVAKDMDVLKMRAKQLGNVKLILIDPLITVVTGDNHKSNDVTRSLTPLLQMAKELNCAIIGLVHFNKTKMYERAIDRLNGSAAWGNVPRMNLMLARDKTNPNGVITRAKTNLAAVGGGYKFDATFEFCLDAEGVGYTVVGVTWNSEFVAGSPEEVLNSVEHAEEIKQKREKPAADRAATYLRTQLIQGPRRRKRLIAEAKFENGPSEKSLDRAFVELNLESRDVICPDGTWAYWGEPWQFDTEMWKQSPHND